LIEERNGKQQIEGTTVATKTKGNNNYKPSNDKVGKGAEERVNQNEI
jgi:hypothetical protein